MAMFIHNEPTSLAMVQEASLPQVFYKLIEAGLEPVIELSTISPHQLTSSFSSSKLPNAIGGLCLDYDLLTSHPSITPGIILIFTSESHIKVLHEKGNAVSPQVLMNTHSPNITWIFGTNTGAFELFLSRISGGVHSKPLSQTSKNVAHTTSRLFLQMADKHKIEGIILLSQMLICPAGFWGLSTFRNVPGACHLAGLSYTRVYAQQPNFQSTFKSIVGMWDKQALFVAQQPESKLEGGYQQKKQLYGQGQTSQTQPHAVASTSTMPPAPVTSTTTSGAQITVKQSRSILLWAHFILFICCASPLSLSSYISPAVSYLITRVYDIFETQRD
ncbi:hypothetical protein BD769DRAFT_1669151 [Suillus cothurnatus]|nr:hypothetical protein BD769DRAFT_1669151 [Suillus cothurnatus]